MVDYKVPLVIAALPQQYSDQATEGMKAAITESYNAAAESIRQSLGDPLAAADQVGAVPHQTADPTTVASRKLRPEYTAFGQTNWSLTIRRVSLRPPRAIRMTQLC